MKPHRLRAQPVSQAVWHWYQDAQTRTCLPAIGSLRYYRFHRRVRLDEFVIHPVNVRHLASDGRALPAELELHAWNNRRRAWQLVVKKELPWLPKGKSHRIKLGGITTRCMKAVILRQHPAPPNAWEQWASPYNVPYGTLANVEWIGRELTPFHCDLPMQPRLGIVRNRAKAPRGMTLRAECDQVRFTSPQFSVGFSLMRPLLLHLGWDSASGGKSSANMLFNRVTRNIPDGEMWGETRVLSGPLWNTLDWDCHARLWGGTVSVEGNVVSYRRLQSGRPTPSGDSGSNGKSGSPEGVGLPLSIDAEFEIRSDGLDLRLSQRTNSDRETVECEAWRFVWDGRTAAVATLGMPRQDAGRTGAVELPAIWAAPGYGNLSCRHVSGDHARLQVDSWRQHTIGWAGIVFGQPISYPHSYRLGRNQYQAEFELRVADLLPVAASVSERKRRPLAHARGYHPELRRNWGPGLMFRAELAGFSNNSLSTNCHLSQTGVTDLAAYTAPPKVGPAPIELARYTITMGLKDGRGYGDCRECYQDSDPSLLNAAGRIHQVAPDIEWLADVWPFIRRATERILSKVDRRGLVVAPLASGNYGDKPTITNAWDCVNFGHYDGYSNVETYRAFRNVVALARAVGEVEFTKRVAHAAERMHRAFASCFYNPKTGWFGSWRSRDGDLHDYGHICVNGPACLYGLVPRAKARRILARMEAQRLALGINNFSYGIPATLLPIRQGDHFEGKWGWGFREDGADGFGVFCNGCLTLAFGYYYVRAMTVFGFRKTADQMAREIFEGHALGRLVGGVGTGTEFYTHEGIICGYEGAFVLQFPALLAVAHHLGWVKPLEPEWWLE